MTEPQKITMYVPVDKYFKQLEQMVKKLYREETPMEAESYQHEMEKVLNYNEATGSAYYPLYGE